MKSSTTEGLVLSVAVLLRLSLKLELETETSTPSKVVYSNIILPHSIHDSIAVILFSE